MAEILGYSNSFTGPATALEVNDPFCYAYSGPVQSAAGGGSFDGLIFDFTTGNYLADINLNYTVANAGAQDVYVRVKLNDSIIMQVAYSASDHLDGNGNLPLNFIIPAYTKFKMEWGIDSVTKDMYSLITGRIHK